MIFSSTSCITISSEIIGRHVGSSNYRKISRCPKFNDELCEQICMMV